MNKSFSEYTELEFISALEKLINECSTAPDDELADLLESFETVTGHPAGSDLIYYPALGADASASGITKTVKRWREANSLPGFKE